MLKIKEFLSGKKVYALMIFGALAAIFQYATGIDLGMSALPVAHDIPALIQELFAFATASGFRAALAK